MHQASYISNIGQGAIILIVTNQGGQNNREKGHSRLLNLIRISLVAIICYTQPAADVFKNWNKQDFLNIDQLFFQKTFVWSSIFLFRYSFSFHVATKSFIQYCENNQC